MTNQRLMGFTLAIAALGLVSGCPSGTSPDVTASPSPAANPSPSPTPVASPSPSPTPTMAASPSPSPSPIPSPSVSPSPAAAATVSFKEGKLTPENVVINASGTVTWKNEDGTVHTVSPEEIGVFRGTGDIEPSTSSRAVMFNGVGAKRYHCTYHPEEVGTVTVVDDKALGASEPSTLP